MLKKRLPAHCNNPTCTADAKGTPCGGPLILSREHPRAAEISTPLICAACGTFTRGTPEQVVMKRIKTRDEAYAALHNALDLVKAIQAATVRGPVALSLPPDAIRALADARAALDVAAQVGFERRSPTCVDCDHGAFPESIHACPCGCHRNATT